MTEPAAAPVADLRAGPVDEPAVDRPDPEVGGDRSRRARAAGAAALVVLGAAAWFAWCLPATASRRGRPGARLVGRWPVWSWCWDHLAAPSSPHGLAVAVLVAVVVSFGAWAVLVAATWGRGDRWAVRLVVGAAALAALVGVAAQPNQTSDVWDYALFGRVAAVHGGEPYRDLPDAHPEDPVYPYSSHRYTGRADNKLPVWTGAATAVAEVAGDDPVHVLLAFRLLLASSTVATTALIASIVRRLRPDGAAAAAAAFGLNPVTVVYGPAKSDALMVLLVVAAVALVVVDRRAAAVVLAAASVLVKLISAPVLVLLLGLPGREVGRGRRTVAGALLGRLALAGGVAAVAYAPFDRPVDLFRTHLSGSERSSVAGPLHRPTLVAVAVLLVVAIVAARRARPPDAPAQAAVLLRWAAPAALAFAVLLTRPGLPWYLLTALALVALGGSAGMLAVLGAVSAVSFTMGAWDVLGTEAHPLPDLLPSRRIAYLAFALLALLAMAVRWWRQGPAQERPRSVRTAVRSLRTAGRSG